MNGGIQKPDSFGWGATAFAVMAAFFFIAFTIGCDALAASIGAQMVGPSNSESRGVSKAPPPQPINWDKVT